MSPGRNILRHRKSPDANVSCCFAETWIRAPGEIGTSERGFNLRNLELSGHAVGIRVPLDCGADVAGRSEELNGS